jgi:hypothetical protein
MKNLLLSVAICLSPLAFSQAAVGADKTNGPDKFVEHSQPIRRTSEGLGTIMYRPTDVEKRAIKAYTDGELASGSPESGTLKGKPGRRVAWFGIVRDVHEDKAKNETRLRVEMKYFDAMTDLHLQIVSLYGAGDFEAVIPGTGHGIKNLSLVRVYGKVVGETAGLPLVSAQFVRDWDWGLFAFMDYGSDKSNPQWVKLRKVDKFHIYSGEPDQQYYEDRIGSR